MKKLCSNAIVSKALLGLTPLFAFALYTNAAHAQEWDRKDALKADLSPFEQVPSVLAPSRGSFEAEINEDGTISFQLSYANMSSPVVQAHIHFGASRTNGGVVVFLCGGNVKPACPASGTVTGTITASDVSILPVSNSDSVIPQGLQPGDLAGLIKAIRSGDTYVNVHTTTFPSGEIRGQVHMDSY
ncbi:MAG TPA: CHRD domain-containing protein [Alloacidobacterium sp.]|nr:CHRD domain-containing protein [Alloacidobacterium sp.]